DVRGVGRVGRLDARCENRVVPRRSPPGVQRAGAVGPGRDVDRVADHRRACRTGERESEARVRGPALEDDHVVEGVARVGREREVQPRRAGEGNRVVRVVAGRLADRGRTGALGAGRPARARHALGSGGARRALGTSRTCRAGDALRALSSSRALVALSSGGALVALRSGSALRALRAGDALGAGRAARAGRAHRARRAGDALCTLRAGNTLGTGSARDALGTLRAGNTLGTGSARDALGTLRAGNTLG